MASHLDQRVPHPRGGFDRRAGDRLHLRARDYVRAGGARRGPRRQLLRPATLLLLQRSQRLSRGDREVPRRAAAVGPDHARPLRRHRAARAAAPLPHADRRQHAHTAAAGQQHRAGRAAGAGRGTRRHAVPALQRPRRGARAADRGGGPDRAPDAADHRRGDGCHEHRRSRCGILGRRAPYGPPRDGGGGDPRSDRPAGGRPRRDRVRLHPAGDSGRRLPRPAGDRERRERRRGDQSVRERRRGRHRGAAHRSRRGGGPGGSGRRAPLRSRPDRRAGRARRGAGRGAGCYESGAPRSLPRSRRAPRSARSPTRSDPSSGSIRRPAERGRRAELPPRPAHQAPASASSVHPARSARRGFGSPGGRGGPLRPRG